MKQLVDLARHLSERAKATRTSSGEDKLATQKKLFESVSNDLIPMIIRAL